MTHKSNSFRERWRVLYGYSTYKYKLSITCRVLPTMNHMPAAHQLTLFILSLLGVLNVKVLSIWT